MRIGRNRKRTRRNVWRRTFSRFDWFSWRDFGRWTFLFLEQKFPKPNLLLVFGQNKFRIHSCSDATLVSTPFTLSSIVQAQDTVAAAFADELRRLCLLVSSPEECSTAEANDAAVAADVDLVGLWNVSTDEAEVQIVFVVRIVEGKCFWNSSHCFRQKSWNVQAV